MESDRERDRESIKANTKWHKNITWKGYHYHNTHNVYYGDTAYLKKKQKIFDSSYFMHLAYDGFLDSIINLYSRVVLLYFPFISTKFGFDFWVISILHLHIL